MPRYELSKQARDDLAEVFEYIAAENEPAALALDRRLLELFKRLEEHPQLGRSKDEVQEGLRSIPHGNYVAFYRIMADRLVIVRVLHAARDLDEMFS